MNPGFLDEFKNVWQKPNNAVVQLILINVVVFVTIRVVEVFFAVSHSSPFFELIFRYLQLPAALSTLVTQPWSPVTYFFTHHDFFHLLFNMLFLYWFGRIIQEYLSGKRVIALYVLGGLFGGLLYLLIYNAVPFYTERVATSYMLGASGSVFALVVGAAVLMPNFTVFLMLIGSVKIKYIAVFYVFMSFIGSTGGNAGGEIAHLGGAVAGWLYITRLNKGSDIGGWIIQFITFVKSLFAPQPKIKVTHRSAHRRRSPPKKRTNKTATSSNGFVPEQSEIDAILDKISQSGYESLSSDEKEKLFNAGKKQ